MVRGRDAQLSFEERAMQPSFDPSDDAVSDMTVEQLLEMECERQVKLVLEQSRDMQERFRATAAEAKDLLLQNPTKANASKLEALIDNIATA